MKEILLYTPIWSFVAETIITQMEEAKGMDITMRMNTPGGGVLNGYGVLAKMKEVQSEGRKVNIKIDGAAMSMGAQFLLYADEVTALDVSQIMIHRADMYVETDEDKAYLKRINNDLQAKMLKRVDSQKLKELKGYSVEEMFASEKRVDIFLTAKEAKQIGLVDKIVKLDPKEAKAFSDKYFAIAAQQEVIIDNSKPVIKMTLAELKEKHPSVFAEAKQEGVNAERDRVGAFMAFVDVDPKAVAEGIKKGDNITQTLMAELSRKAMSAEALKKIEGENPPAVATEEVEAKAKTEKEKEVEAFQKEVKDLLKIKTA